MATRELDARSNSEHLAEGVLGPLAAYAAERGDTELTIDQWPASLVDDVVAGFMTDLLHFASVRGRRNADATLELVKVHYDNEHQAS